MPVGSTIDIRGLSKSFASVSAVTDLTFSVEPGVVTGFLGPNGAGKTTTLRTLLGLVTATSGTATFGGTPYRQLTSPLATVGASLEAASFHPGRSARNHLKVYARAAGLNETRVDRVLEQVGLVEYADRRVGGYSLGMRQRLGLAFALLGDPGVLVLDEPINGLDPEGIKWIRSLLRQLAGEGRTILVSSHLLSEVQQTVDRVVIIARGELVHQGTLHELEAAAGTRVMVDSPDRERLRQVLEDQHFVVEPGQSFLVVADAKAEDVGAIAQRGGVALSHLAAEQIGLEQVFLDLVGNGAKP